MEDHLFIAIKTIIKEAELAINNQKRLINNSDLNKALMSVSALDIGASLSLTTIIGLGNDALIKAGQLSSNLSSGLIGPKTVGLINPSLPAIGLVSLSNSANKHINQINHLEESKRLLRIAKKDYDLITKEIENNQISKERAEYLKSLNILIHQAIDDLEREIK